MNPKAVLVLLALATTLGQPEGGKLEASMPLPAGAERVARDFLFAFSRNDRDAIRSMLPSQLRNLYGPCPFVQMPVLSKPRADTRIGVVEFQGRMADPGLPAKGAFVLRLVEEDGVRRWRVRQIYWYDELPKEAKLPDRSPTPADRAQEPAVRAAAEEFVRAWLAGDFERLDGLTFHWWEVPRSAPKWVKMKDADLAARPTNLDGLRVDFVAKLRVARVLPKDVQGYVWLVQEGGRWCVRPLTFAFLF